MESQYSYRFLAGNIGITGKVTAKGISGLVPINLPVAIGVVLGNQRVRGVRYTDVDGSHGDAGVPVCAAGLVADGDGVVRRVAVVGRADGYRLRRLPVAG